MESILWNILARQHKYLKFLVDEDKKSVHKKNGFVGINYNMFSYNVYVTYKYIMYDFFVLSQ